jgi:hypothetical protein
MRLAVLGLALTYAVSVSAQVIYFNFSRSYFSACHG